MRITNYLLLTTLPLSNRSNHFVIGGVKTEDDEGLSGVSAACSIGFHLYRGVKQCSHTDLLGDFHADPPKKVL